MFCQFSHSGSKQNFSAHENEHIIPERTQSKAFE